MSRAILLLVSIVLHTRFSLSWRIQAKFDDGGCDGTVLKRFCKGDECCFKANLMKVKTTGASPVTAQIDHLNYTGVGASHTIAQTDLSNVLKLKEKIINVSQETWIDAEVIAAIISRESRANPKLLDKDGYARTKVRAFGAMQMLYRETTDGPFSEDHFLKATELLISKIEIIRKMHPDWSNEYILKGALAAYNMGEKNVWTIENMDVGTNNGDYSNDVIARAQWYKMGGYFEK